MRVEQLKLALDPPRLLPPISAWLAHLPLGMAVVDWLRPRCIVELGTHMGASYCGFCQAVAALALEARCTAVDTWRGDAQAGWYGPDVLANLKAHHDPLYGRFSQLMPRQFDEALPQFPDGSIDLLHMDGLHTYEAVRHDLDAWLPKLSARGVLLLHDTQVRERDFGVWRAWEELAARYPSFEWTHGYGLGLAAVGEEAGASLRDLLAWCGRDPGQVRAVFARLGALIVQAQAGTLLPAQAPGNDKASWRAATRAALEAAADSLLQLPGEMPPALRRAHLEAMLDTHAPHWRRVSVVVPALNGGACFGALLEAIKGQQFAGEVEIVVVDSGSRDQTVPLAQQAGAKVLNVPPASFNHGTTRNAGIAEATGDIIILLSQDAVPADSTLVASLVRNFVDPHVAGVYARQVPRPGHDPVTAWRVENGYAGGTARRVQFLHDAEAFAALPPQAQMEICVFDNVCAALRRCVWVEHPLPARTFAEDMAWARTVMLAGWRVIYEPAAMVTHSHARGLGHEVRRNQAHAAAMEELFGFHPAPVSHQALALFRHQWQQDRAIIRQRTTGLRRWKLLLQAPLVVAARVLGTYRGRAAARRRGSDSP